MAIRLREGRWALSRIIREDDGGFAVAAMRDSLAQSIEAYYPPLNEGRSDYTLPFALVRLQGAVISPPNGDTRLVPAMLVDSTLRDLTNQQRQTLRSHLEEWFTGYQFRDYDGTVTVKQAFSAAGYTLDTPLRRILLDVFGHLGHSESRRREIIPESHNTEYLDDFSTDPTSRWTFELGSASWDSGNNEYDFNTGTTSLARYSANNPGSIEHEAQVTAVEGSSRTPYCAVRINSGGADDWYGVHSNADNNFDMARWVAGSRTTLALWSLTRASGDFITRRLAASGGVGANVVIDGWRTNHGTTKPSDPGWHGADGTPDHTYTDTSVDRHDDSDDIECGIGGRNGAGDHDSRHCFWKSRAISDRGGGATGQPTSRRHETVPFMGHGRRIGLVK